MGSHAARSGRFLAVWLPAVVLVPAVLAGVALLWPGPRIGEDVGSRASAALTAAGLAGVRVAVSGRDVALTEVPSGAVDRAREIVAGVAGVRSVEAAPGVPDGLPAPAPPGAAAELAALVAAAPVTFAADSAVLDGAAAETVAGVGRWLVAHPDVRVRLTGHAADTPGPAEVALALSQQRAQAVAEALRANGVDPSRVSARGVGDADPLPTPAASRRVEIGVG
ncbi:OmpA family protein [Pseudonocardia benzenivorans]|uniref:OmpA/MotB domain protein n=2 Tax=Pseudonocardia TaxID=1847 RepID=F4CYV7_PSEUX|nr:OmpA family protein [Pseudonocardia dioxanivorans]AEA27682.1 OmpA/MotB domain protein [Pseudonocardia dioxanivorans CB1190]